jgi:hypothetical protein
MKENVGLLGGSCSRCGKKRNAYRCVVGGPVVSRQLGRSRCRWEENIKIELQEMGCIHVIEDGDKWRAVVNTSSNIRVQRIQGFLVKDDCVLWSFVTTT